MVPVSSLVDLVSRMKASNHFSTIDMLTNASLQVLEKRRLIASELQSVPMADPAYV